MAEPGINGVGKAMVALASVVVLGLAGYTSIVYTSVLDLRQQAEAKRQEDREAVKNALASLDEKVQRDIENLVDATQEARRSSDDNRLRWERAVIDLTELKGDLELVQYRLEHKP